MHNIRISIDRILIRSQGIAPQVARDAIAGLGEALLTELAQHQELLRSGQIHDLNLDHLTVTHAPNASQLRHTIAQSITQAIATNTKDTNGS
jgi:hypothetical protein